MKAIFEQYGFIKSMLDPTSDKVKDSAIFSALINFILLVMGWFNFLANNILGISSFVALMIFLIMVCDLATGIWASLNKSNPIESKKFLRWMFKLGSYLTFMYVLNGLVKESSTYGFEWLVAGINAVKMFALFFISFGEMMSIDENLQKVGYKISFFEFIRKVYKGFLKLFKNNTHIDMGDGEE